MNTHRWILLDTETSGLVAPIYALEVAAQRMAGWAPAGPPFRRLLNHQQDIPAEASRVNGFTREILERDGEPPAEVHAAFAAYVDGLPLCSFNLEYDLDKVLAPEWRRMGIMPIGRRGFCALRLAQRLLDPVPAGNCKLQTLRQYYALPERGAHTALGDVETVADLLGRVLRPLAEARGLDTWDKLCAYAGALWFPSRIQFGKFKGRDFREARRNPELRRWLGWLSRADNARTASMGQWYLARLEQADPAEMAREVVGSSWCAVGRAPASPTPPAAGALAVVLYVNPVLSELHELVCGAQSRLAEAQAAYTAEKAKVDGIRGELFRRLKAHYQRRDRARLLFEYRTRYLDDLLRAGEEAAAQAEHEYHQAKAQSDSDYEHTARAVAQKRALSDPERAELDQFWRKLVRLYHPDRFRGDTAKLATYHRLTTAINLARDSGDLPALREIADDPAGYIARRGWTRLDFSEEQETAELRRLYDSLQVEIIGVLEALNTLRASRDFELLRFTETQSGVLDTVVEQRSALLTKEAEDLEAKAQALATQIAELTTIRTGEPASAPGPAIAVASGV